MRLAEHRTGLADTRGRAEVDAQFAASLRWHAVSMRLIGACRLRRWRRIGGSHMNIIYRTA
jgi:hypothetical protein